MEVGEYYVKWQYTNKEVLKKEKKINCVNTKCLIFANKILLYSANTVCSPNDIDNKDTARKISLQRAIKLFGKDTRIKFWEAYRVMTKTPKW